MKSFVTTALTGGLVASAGFVSAGHGHSAAAVDWPQAQRIEVRMIEYEFVPSTLRLHHGVPYRLHLINAGKEGHDFTAPDFFAAVQVKNRDALTDGRSIYLPPGASADVYFIAPAAALFAPRCADHDWAGMTATIVID
ncbi:MAG TPA: hypothetical protein VGX95_08675 [Xanthobacteraceae bacterium]|jgi:uncharacterized cupredoxin-like copper-binding protein|nr:hypothetical protein [Xanthobacteraceae bacterium]